MATEARSLVVEATLEDNQLRIGMDQVKQQLQETAIQGDKANQSFRGLSNTASDIAGSLANIGTVGLAAITGLATQSPATADEMAKIKKEIFELSRVSGEVLEPVFAELPGLIESVGNSLNESNIASQLAGIASEGISDLSSLISGDLSNIENIFPKAGLVAAGARGGFKVGGFKGALLGAALGYAAESAIATDANEGYEDTYGTFAESQTLIENIRSDYNPDTISNNPLVGIPQTAMMMLKWVQAGGQLTVDTVQHMFRDKDNKNMQYANPNGVPR